MTFFTVAGPISALHAPSTIQLRRAARCRRSQLPLLPRPGAPIRDSSSPITDTITARQADRPSAFVQEWHGFPSHEAAVAQTKQGLETFSRAIGTRPAGGKYGGWDYNGFAERRVDACGFIWWCRDWMPRDMAGRIPDAYYEPQFFGKNLVVALPSTVHGHFWDSRQIDLLLARRQLIAIEEHIAPIRPDGLVQTPNIVDDMSDLRRLYQYLRGKERLARDRHRDRVVRHRPRTQPHLRHHARRLLDPLRRPGRASDAHPATRLRRDVLAAAAADRHHYARRRGGRGGRSAA